MIVSVSFSECIVFVPVSIHRIHNVADHVAWKYGLKTVIKAIDTHLTSEFWDDAQTKVEDPKRVFDISFRGGSL